MRGLIDNSVNLGGNQTITGVKTYTDNIKIIEKVDITQTPASSFYGKGVEFYDQNGVRFVKIQPVILSAGYVCLQNTVEFDGASSRYQARINQSSKDSEIWTDSISPNAGTVVATSSIAGNAVKFGGIQINMAYQSGTDSSGTITYSKPFAGLKSSTPKIATSIQADISEPRAVRIYDITTTNFKYTAYRQAGSGAIEAGTAFEWIAVGF